MNIVSIVVLSLFIFGAYAQDVVTIATSKLRPTQMGIGFEVVDELCVASYVRPYMEKQGIDFKSGKRLSSYMGQIKKAGKLSDFVSNITDNFKSHPFPGARAGDGQSYYHFDGHHRARGIVQMNKAILEVEPERQKLIEASVSVIEDFSGLSDFEVARRIITGMKRGYVLPEIRKKILTDSDPNDDLQMLRAWASSTETIVDYPPRTLAGNFLYQEGITSGRYQDYIEFTILENMDPKFSQIPAGQRITENLAKEFKHSFYSNPQLIEYISRLVRNPQHAIKVKAEIEVRHYDYRRLHQVETELSPEQKQMHGIFSQLDQEKACGPLSHP